MRGITSYAGYIPFRRLDRSEIFDSMGSGGGHGQRSVASFDEDTTTMAVEAARLALATTDEIVNTLLFSTTTPTYLDRTNATAIHAALGLAGESAAIDMLGSQRSAVGALQVALEGSTTTLVVAADIRTGLPTSSDESAGGDGASAMVVGSGDGVIAEYLGGATATGEFVDRWRSPGETRSKLWEEKFGEHVYSDLAQRAWANALAVTELSPGDITIAALTGLHTRAIRRGAKSLAINSLVDDLQANIGNSGAAHPGILLAAMLDNASPGDVLGLVIYADGVQVLFFRATEALEAFEPKQCIASQVAAKGSVSYSKFLSWRGNLKVEPPRRPEPDRPSSSAAYRNRDWKFGFSASRDSAGVLHMPPARVSTTGGDEQMAAVPMANAVGTIATFTIDKLVYSPSPPVVFGVIDFDDGGRLPMEITDVDPDDVAIGDRVEPTFRRLYDGDGIANYFWKARPIRG